MLALNSSFLHENTPKTINQTCAKMFLSNSRFHTELVNRKFIFLYITCHSLNFHKLYSAMHQSFVTTVPAPGNSGEFDFQSSNFLLKVPHCGDSQLVKPQPLFPAVCHVLHCTAILPIYMQHKFLAFPTQYGDNGKVKPHYIYSAIPCPSPGRGVVTNDWCIRDTHLKFLVRICFGMVTKCK